MQVERMEQKAKDLQMQNRHLEVFDFDFFYSFVSLDHFGYEENCSFFWFVVCTSLMSVGFGFFQ